jgi:hypothetical protein
LVNIRSRAPSSRIILVTTHADEVDESEGRRWLEELEKHKCESYHGVDSCSPLVWLLVAEDGEEGRANTTPQ